MISLAKLAANRANAQRSTGPKSAAGKRRVAQNAQKSTGPRTPAGKRRAAQNARRHGLTLALCCEPGTDEKVAALARAIAGADATPSLVALATPIAIAQLDLVWMQRVRLHLVTAAFQTRGDTRRLAALERYERRVRLRRELAVLAFDAARLSAQAASDCRHPDERNEIKAEPSV
jgi:hypothetical protein